MPRVPSYLVWLIVAGCAYGALYFLANRSAFNPSKYPQGFWVLQSQVGASDVWLDTPDGVQLHAWWVHREDTRLATLFLHGNSGNLSDRIPHLREITAAGSSVLILDYRGYGKSGGRPTEKGIYIDSETAFVYLLGHGYRAKQIVLHGESLGTAVAVDLASRRPCAGLILEAPFTSGSDVADTKLPVLGRLLIHSFDSARKIRWVLKPKLFIHGDEDEVIPERLGQSLYANAQAPKSFWVIEGAGHNNIIETSGPQYRERLAAFYASLKP